MTKNYQIRLKITHPNLTTIDKEIENNVYKMGLIIMSIIDKNHKKRLNPNKADPKLTKKDLTQLLNMGTKTD